MEEAIIKYLRLNKIEYQLIEHPPIYTMNHTKEIKGITLEEGAKSLLLKAKNDFILAVLPGHKKLDSKKLKAYLQVKDLRFATPIEVGEMMHCEIGSCYPLGN